MKKPRITYRHITLYAISGGRIDPSSDQAGFLKLTTTGRKSGKERTVTLLYIGDADSYVVTASNGGKDAHPGWYFNVQSNPEVTIQVKKQTKKAIAEVAGPERRRELWPRLLEIDPMYAGYEKRGSR
jgi:deazaflavin-dependent oxidoreductase (nitroreductase family)